MFALDAVNFCLVVEHLTRSVPALQGIDGLWY